MKVVQAHKIGQLFIYDDLLLADGMTITDAAAAVGLSRRHSYKWIRRFLEQGLEGLHDKPRSHRRIEPGQAGMTDQNDVDIVF